MKNWLTIALCMLGLVIFTLQLPTVVAAEGDPSVYECQSNPELPGCPNVETKPTPEVDNVSFTVWDYLKMIGALLFVVLLLYGVLYMIKKQSHTALNASLVQTLGGASVGNQKSVQVVRVGERILVVGVGDSVSLLQEIRDEEEIQQMISQANTALDLPKQQFAKFRMNTLIQAVRQRGNSNVQTNTHEENNASHFNTTLSNVMAEIRNDRLAMHEEIERSERP
ncbi:MAG: flagellar biosynthetic protein FliO [Bacilli bacterium]